MDAVFLKILNMSLAASWLVLAVLVLRFLLKKAPKWLHCLLWALVAVRLLCPFSFESVLSLIPSREVLPETVVSGPSFDVNTGIQVIDRPMNDYLGDRYFEGVTVPANNGSHVMTVLALIWLLGMAAMALYAILSYRKLRRQVSASIALGDTVYLCDYIETPFILGVVKPRIYLPSSMDPNSAAHVLAHEKAHIKRRDHWWKPLGFGLLTIHWFNPLMWLAYILLCRDIELACDEKVIRQLGTVDKKAYSEALLHCSVPRHMIAACPLAFGEVGVKERVKSVLNYKKPTFWIVLLAVIACVVTAVCFLTDPKSETQAPFGKTYRVEEIVYHSPAISFAYTVKDAPAVEIMEDGTFKIQEGEEWLTPGILEETELTQENFDAYFIGTFVGISAAKLREENQQAWQLYVSDRDSADASVFYYLLLQENGDLYLTQGTWRSQSSDLHTGIHNVFKLVARADSGFTMGNLMDIDANAVMFIRTEAAVSETVLGETAKKAEIREILDSLGEVYLDPEPISQSRGEDRPSGYTITIRLEKTIVTYHIDESCSQVWVDDGVKLSYSYTILEPVLFEALLEKLMDAETNTETGIPATFQEWLANPGIYISYGTLVYMEDDIIPCYDQQEPEELQRLAELLQSIEADVFQGAVDETVDDYFVACLFGDSGQYDSLPYVTLNYDGERVLIWYKAEGEMQEFITDDKALCAYMQSLYEADRREYYLYGSPMEEPVTYSYGYANISVPQWSFFEYEIVEYTDESTPFGIRLRPKEEEGWLYVSYWPNGFGVCGTGLEERSLGSPEDSTFTYTAGYYDGSEDWSYIVVGGAPGSYVLTSEGAEEWIERFPGYFGDILYTSVFGQGVPTQAEVQAIIDDTRTYYDELRMSFDYQPAAGP